ncbi:diguanylate cyclase domain-containing protein [Streptomyces viridosporus]|uniref:diguanylate cyclase domain-containing protein n=1 Tax=Streptomyces viridosporus TaxID=67581 RepID=UPI0009983E54
MPAACKGFGRTCPRSGPERTCPRHCPNRRPARGFILCALQDCANPRASDADHFKQINDTAGHPGGDAVLAAFGARITAWAGPRAAAGRLGGDEFAVVLELPVGRREQRLAQLVRMLHTPVTLDDGRTLQVAASVGAAAADVLGVRDLTGLQRAADTALYDGKHSGRAVLATPAHTTVPSINGRRAGRPGTAVWGRAA